MGGVVTKAKSGGVRKIDWEKHYLQSVMDRSDERQEYEEEIAKSDLENEVLKDQLAYLVRGLKVIAARDACPAAVDAQDLLATVEAP